ncbi:MAG: YraN family protein [Oscillospiraceae bacterium]
MTNKETGSMGENAVCGYLEKKGYRILERNFRIKGGEIDIIACNDEFIAFVEVKTRKKNSMTDALDAVNYSKKKFIIRTASEYSCRNPLKYQPRFDIAEVITDKNTVVRINYIENAFDTTDYGYTLIMCE